MLTAHLSADGGDSRHVGTTSEARELQACNLLFMHGSHTDLAGSLAEASNLLKKAIRGAPSLFMGDFNVDELPRDPSDPYKLDIDRKYHHIDRRRDLDKMCRIHKFRLLPVLSILGSQGLPHAYECQNHPIARIPVGDGLGRPSRLDLAFSNSPAGSCVNASFILDWNEYFSDHCLTALDVVGCVVRGPIRSPSTWRCSNEAEFVVACATDLPDHFVDIQHIHTLSLTLQATWKQSCTSNERRSLRESAQVKDLRRQLRGAASEPIRRALQAELLEAKRHITCTLRQIAQIHKFNAGGSISRSKKLYTITSMKAP